MARPPGITVQCYFTKSARRIPPSRWSRHSGSETGFAFSPDGGTLGSTSWDKTAILWDVTRAGPQPVCASPATGETVNDICVQRMVAGSPRRVLTSPPESGMLPPVNHWLKSFPGRGFCHAGRLVADAAFPFLHCKPPTPTQRPIFIALTGRQIYQRLGMHTRSSVRRRQSRARPIRQRGGRPPLSSTGMRSLLLRRRSDGTEPTPPLSRPLAYSPDGSLLASGSG